VTSLLEVCGGLALFLFGVRMLSTGMEKLAGDRLQTWLDRMTNRPIKGAVFGAVATALIQSSSLLMVTMMGLINANLLTLEQVVGVMMGQEIGTTLTAQIVAFEMGDLCYLFIALGFILTEASSQRGRRKYGEILLGFGVLFMGMQLMGQHLLWGILAGALATAVIQSSSAITGLVVAMGVSNVIALPGAIAVILGANIGTCITGLIASFRLARPTRRVSIAQILINVVGVVIFIPFISPFTSLVATTSSSLPRQIANAHTMFNLAVSAALFPFVRPIARLAERLVPKSEEERRPKLTHFIDEKLYSLPSIALAEAAKEVNRMAEATVEMISLSHRALVEDDMSAAQKVLDKESGFIDPLCEVLEGFVNTLMQGNLSGDQQKRASQLKALTTDIERVGDLSENLAQAAQETTAHSIVFSRGAVDDLDSLFRQAHLTYDLAVRALRHSDCRVAELACSEEDALDRMYSDAREAHIMRLESGECHSEAEVIFVESLRNLERIGDHAENLGLSVMRA